MARFQFIGNGDSDPTEITLYGATFTLNGPAQDLSGEAAAKLGGNAHFRAVEAHKAQPAPKPAEDSRKALQDALTARGVDFDKRWGVERLKAALGASHGDQG